jgi:hypothetical protein
MNAKLRKLRIPNPLESQEESERFEHQDLARLDDFPLWQARRQAVRALETMDEKNESARDWWIERLRRIDAEERSRANLNAEFTELE